MSQPTGLQYRKVDLHMHTPASHCYEYPEHTPGEIVQAAIENGLDAIAVTDHNTAAWIGRIKSAAQNAALTVFPWGRDLCS
jgi:predicted metal-dependent phosphoesterase TrpH